MLLLLLLTELLRLARLLLVLLIELPRLASSMGLDTEYSLVRLPPRERMEGLPPRVEVRGGLAIALSLGLAVGDLGGERGACAEPLLPPLLGCKGERAFSLLLLLPFFLRLRANK